MLYDAELQAVAQKYTGRRSVGVSEGVSLSDDASCLADHEPFHLDRSALTEDDAEVAEVTREALIEEGLR